jgi:hypothetical protein
MAPLLLYLGKSPSENLLIEASHYHFWEDTHLSMLHTSPVIDPFLVQSPLPLPLPGISRFLSKTMHGFAILRNAVYKILSY